MSREHCTIVTVEFNNPEDTARLIGSVRRAADSQTLSVVIVDNGVAEDDTHPEGAASESFAIRRLSPRRNLYYWGAADFALTIMGEANFPPWIVVCNNDVEFDPTFFLRLRELDPISYPIIAPAILSTVTGRDQNPILTESPGTLARLRWRLYDSSYLAAQVMLAVRAVVKGLSWRIRTRARKAQLQENIFAAHGACVVFSREFFRRGGQLDTEVPLFAEELTLAVEARRLGMVIRHIPSLRVSHREHSTTGFSLTRFKYGLERRARDRFYELESRS